MEWTTEQQQVIDLRKRDILVSAAAGSGKTAVLVERILNMVTDPDDPVDVDRLLIVTFTKAAAAEMRGRLYDELVKRAEAMPENLHLRRQLQLVQKAQVCTIDSFCSMVVRSYGHEVDIDPTFRIGDTGEIALIENDVLNALLEEEYLNGSPEFLDFAEEFAAGKNDSKLAEVILKLYQFSESSTWPAQWRQDCLKSFEITSAEDIGKTQWGKWYLEQVKNRVESILTEYERVLDMCRFPGGPDYCYEAFSTDMERLRHLQAFIEENGEDYDRVREKILATDFLDKPRRKSKGYDVELHDRIAERRKAIVDQFKKLKNQFEESGESVVAVMRKAAPAAREIVRLADRFAELFDAAKKKKGIASFSDVEHMALEILYRDGQRTAAARQLASRFTEVMIDEYQDSNDVQETLLKAVSREADGNPNIFMVGDMKQSIYRFRMARPELFMDKYEHYTTAESDHQKVELHANFRSRKGVIDSVNYIFSQIMQPFAGGIEYNDDAALVYKADYKETEKKTAERAEIMLLELPGADETDEGFTRPEWEARMIAQEIRKITDPADPMYVQSKEGYRPVRYSDIVVLLRASNGWDAPFQEVFEEAGIPAYTESKGGYFSAWEVQLMLNFLSCVDNPVNDIPLVSVMKSPLFGFTSEELALIRAGYLPDESGNGYFGAMKDHIQKEGPCAEKASAFLSALENYRRLSMHLSLSMLLRRIYSDFGVIARVSAMPGGARRKANLQALLQKAEDFEKTSYHGIYHFIRYIDKLKKYSMDEGEQSIVDENDNTVRIMTIHKSKGLEFPVVFVAGCSKTINEMDLRQPILLHQEYGIALDAVDHTRRTRAKTLVKQTFAERIKTENLGEELRVLYVALTRAREKLYITGVVKSIEKMEESYAEYWTELPGKLSYTDVIGASSHMSWILKSYHEDGPIDMRYVYVSDLVGDTVAAVEDQHRLTRKTLQEVLTLEEDPDRNRKLQEKLNFNYCYNDLYKMYATMSVSRLKVDRIHALEESEQLADGYQLRDEEEAETKPSNGSENDPEKKKIPRPAFMKESQEQEFSGAERGTLYHLVMEKTDPHIETIEEIRAAIDEMVNNGLISEPQKDTIIPRKIRGFKVSSLGRRFAACFDAGKGYRERQFIIGIPAYEVLKELDLPRDPEELLMVQGIIDMYFEEEDGLVIVDYKTDAVKTAEELVKRYKLQLDLYARALEQITGKKVKEKWIYSFALGQEILLDSASDL